MLHAVDSRCPIPHRELSGTSFDVQVGYEIPEIGEELMMPWVTLPLRD